MNLSAKNETKISYIYDVLDKTKEFNNSQVVVKTGLKCSQEKLHFSFAKAKHRFLKGVSEIYAIYGLN